MVAVSEFCLRGHSDVPSTQKWMGVKNYLKLQENIADLVDKGGRVKKSKKIVDVIYGISDWCRVVWDIIHCGRHDDATQHIATRRAPRTPSNLRHIALNGSSGAKGGRGGAKGRQCNTVSDSLRILCPIVQDNHYVLVQLLLPNRACVSLNQVERLGRIGDGGTRFPSWK